MQRDKTSSMKQKARGVTLIELIMVIVVVGVLAGGLSLGITETINLWNFLTFRNEIVSEGRMALMRMGREIRQMPLRTPTFEPIQLADSDQLRFTVIDLDADDIDDELEFYRDTGNDELRRIFNGNPAEGDILAGDVSNLVFTYYDENNIVLSTPVTDPSDIYRITIELELSYRNQTLTLRSQIFPRNL